jgi:hypothetical protein
MMSEALLILLLCVTCFDTSFHITTFYKQMNYIAANERIMIDDEVAKT